MLRISEKAKSSHAASGSLGTWYLKAPVLELKIYPLVLYTLCQLVRHKQHFYGNLISIS